MQSPSEIPLTGGRANVGAVVRIDDQVARPTHPQTATVDHFLSHLRNRGVDFVPRPLGSDSAGRQRLQFIPGETPAPPYPAWAFDETLLVEVARLQRRLHRAAVDYEPPVHAVWATTAGDYFPPRAVGSEHPLVCHNDLGMTNVVVDDNRCAVGIIDFDYCRPVDPLFDIAVAIRHWAPFGDLDFHDDSHGDLRLDRVRRFARFCDEHDLDTTDRRSVVHHAIEFLDHARHNIAALAAGGNVAFRQLLAGGYEATNRATVAWLHERVDTLATA